MIGDGAAWPSSVSSAVPVLAVGLPSQDADADREVEEEAEEREERDEDRRSGPSSSGARIRRGSYGRARRGVKQGSALSARSSPRAGPAREAAAGSERLEAVAHAARAAGEVHDQARADDARAAAGEGGERRLAKAVGAQQLGEARGLALESRRAVASGVTSRGPRPVPPVVTTSAARAAASRTRDSDFRALVRDDGGLDLVRPASRRIRAGLAAGDVVADAAGHGVADGDDGGAGQGCLAFALTGRDAGTYSDIKLA